MYSSRDQHGLKDVSSDCVAMLYLRADGLTDLGPSTNELYVPTTTKLAILFMPLFSNSSATFKFLLLTLGSSMASFSTESASFSPLTGLFFFLDVVPVCLRDILQYEYVKESTTPAARPLCLRCADNVVRTRSFERGCTVVSFAQSVRRWEGLHPR